VCFAAEADALVGAAVVAIGVDALRDVEEPKEIPLAALPLLLGLHQLSEAFVWWGLQGHVAHSIERASTWVYLLFAFSALPILIAIAVGLVEPVVARRHVIAAFGLLASVVAIALTTAMVRGTLEAAIDSRHIEYSVDTLGYGGQLTGLYVLATCGALLASSYRDLATLGVLNLVVVPLLMALTIGGFVSLWCFWAAIVSVVIDLHMRRPVAIPPPARIDA
jgi:hypothetical protein